MKDVPGDCTILAVILHVILYSQHMKCKWLKVLNKSLGDGLDSLNSAEKKSNPLNDGSRMMTSSHRRWKNIQLNIEYSKFSFGSLTTRFGIIVSTYLS